MPISYEYRSSKLTQRHPFRAGQIYTPVTDDTFIDIQVFLKEYSEEPVFIESLDFSIDGLTVVFSIDDDADDNDVVIPLLQLNDQTTGGFFSYLTTAGHKIKLVFGPGIDVLKADTQLITLGINKAELEFDCIIQPQRAVRSIDFQSATIPDPESSDTPPPYETTELIESGSTLKLGQYDTDEDIPLGHNTQWINTAKGVVLDVLEGAGEGLYGTCPEGNILSINSLLPGSTGNITIGFGDCYKAIPITSIAVDKYNITQETEPDWYIEGEVGLLTKGLVFENYCTPRCTTDKLVAFDKYLSRLWNFYDDLLARTYVNRGSTIASNTTGDIVSASGGLLEVENFAGISIGGFLNPEHLDLPLIVRAENGAVASRTSIYSITSTDYAAVLSDIGALALTGAPTIEIEDKDLYNRVRDEITAHNLSAEEQRVPQAQVKYNLSGGNSHTGEYGLVMYFSISVVNYATELKNISIENIAISSVLAATVESPHGYIIVGSDKAVVEESGNAGATTVYDIFENGVDLACLQRAVINFSVFVRCIEATQQSDTTAQNVVVEFDVTNTTDSVTVTTFEASALKPTCVYDFVQTEHISSISSPRDIIINRDDSPQTDEVYFYFPPIYEAGLRPNIPQNNVLDRDMDPEPNLLGVYGIGTEKKISIIPLTFVSPQNMDTGLLVLVYHPSPVGINGNAVPVEICVKYGTYISINLASQVFVNLDKDQTNEVFSSPDESAMAAKGLTLDPATGVLSGIWYGEDGDEFDITVVKTLPNTSGMTVTGTATLLFSTTATFSAASIVYAETGATTLTTNFLDEDYSEVPDTSWAPPVTFLRTSAEAVPDSLNGTTGEVVLPASARQAQTGIDLTFYAARREYDFGVVDSLVSCPNLNFIGATGEFKGELYICNSKPEISGLYASYPNAYVRTLEDSGTAEPLVGNDNTFSASTGSWFNLDLFGVATTSVPTILLYMEETTFGVGLTGCGATTFTSGHATGTTNTNRVGTRIETLPLTSYTTDRKPRLNTLVTMPERNGLILPDFFLDDIQDLTLRPVISYLSFDPSTVFHSWVVLAGVPDVTIKTFGTVATVPLTEISSHTRSGEEADTAEVEIFIDATSTPITGADGDDAEITIQLDNIPEAVIVRGLPNIFPQIDIGLPNIHEFYLADVDVPFVFPYETARKQFTGVPHILTSSIVLTTALSGTEHQLLIKVFSPAINGTYRILYKYAFGTIV